MADDFSVLNPDAADRSPALPVAAALAAGIACDHVLNVPRPAIYATAALAIAALILARRSGRGLRAAALLLLFAALGAGLHLAAWRDRSPDSVTRLLSAEARLVRLTGRTVDAPTIDRRRDTGRKAAWMLDDRSRVVVEAESVAGERSTPRPASGRVQLSVAGHLTHVRPGDRIEVVGFLVRPEPARNPGGFDAADYLRKRGVDALVYADHPDAVRRVEAGGPSLRRAAAAARDRLSERFAEHLSTRNGPVGAAMILGDRSAMPVEIRDAYVASGAMHILAISGMNVGIFAWVLILAGRLANLSPPVVAAATVACAWAYALLTGLEPPVVRASVFLTLWAVGALTLRRTSLLHTTALTALALLLWDPLLLFDVGAQLSFLAVAGMSWSSRALPRTWRLFEEAGETRPWLARAGRWLAAAEVLSLGTWLFTAPAIASVFGLVSPVGLLLNVLLVPAATWVMGAGYAFFGACLLLPLAAPLLGAPFDLGLSLVNGLVAAAGRWDLGHLSVSPPPQWWTLGFYALLLAGWVRPRWAGRRSRSLAAVLAWAALGLTAACLPASRPSGGLRLTILDVGHGGAMLLEAPNGRRLLFDCGSMVDDRRAAEATWRAVRAHGGSSIDLLVLSHADLDHCNNVPALLRGGPVGVVAFARSFLDFAQPVVRESCEAARAGGTPLRLLAAGDEVRLDPTVSVRVLHPPDRGPGDDDNANSVVLRVVYAGRTILLTGDVEGPGQAEMFSREPAAAHDIVLGPHHGGLSANTPEFAEWSRPRTVLFSSGDRVNEAALAEVYHAAGGRYPTSRLGAITVDISPGGALRVAGFAEP